MLNYTHCYMYSASHAYHSALAQVVLLPAHFIALLNIHTELEKVLLIHGTVLMWLSTYFQHLLKAAKRGEEPTKSKNSIFEENILHEKEWRQNLRSWM